MKHSSESIPITDQALEPNSDSEKNECSIAGDGQPDFSAGAGSGCTVARFSAHRAPEPVAGVNSSNTPPQSSKNNKIDLPWIAAEDWFEWALYVDWESNWPKLNRKLSEAKEYAAIANCPKNRYSIPFWGGCAAVDRMGARMGNKKNGLYFAYKLQTEHLNILIADREEPHKTKPSVVMRASGEACLWEGAKTCYENGKGRIPSRNGPAAKGSGNRTGAK